MLPLYIVQKLIILEWRKSVHCNHTDSLDKQTACWDYRMLFTYYVTSLIVVNKDEQCDLLKMSDVTLGSIKHMYIARRREAEGLY